MTTAKPCCRRSFTLVEMLVVIAIIGVLAAILVPTLYRVVIKARQARIAQELSQLYMAIETYRQKFGDYPLDFSDPTLVAKHLRKAFPNHAETSAVLTALNSANLTPAEALVFWLSQLREDVRQPLSGSSDANHAIFPFENSRLKLTRSISLGNRNVDLYHYIPPDGKDAPYVYFDSRTYGTASFTISGETVKPYQLSANGDWVNKTTFQLIAAGLDGEFGDAAGTTKVFPPVPNDLPQLDNIANFSDGKIFEDFLE